MRKIAFEKSAFEDFRSRRIDGEHRLVYKVDDEAVTIIGCKYHS